MDGTQMSVRERIVSLLNEANAPYDVFDHEPEGRTDVVSGIRGNPVNAAAKAMVVKIKRTAGPTFALVVIPGDRRIDFQAVAYAFGGKSASFAQAGDAEALTGCTMGAVPPFTFDERLQLAVDDRLLSEPKIYFNAAVLEQSFAVAAADYIRAAKPKTGRYAT